ncbi:hypothetical protein C7I87_32165 [Mesorhizobium sp. SARCC-RB16n]|nr:hypothetical protein C7I87_32165 [Mesorhizobium sp. SARCC-RB16n]
MVISHELTGRVMALAKQYNYPCSQDNPRLGVRDQAQAPPARSGPLRHTLHGFVSPKGELRSGRRTNCFSAVPNCYGNLMRARIAHNEDIPRLLLQRFRQLSDEEVGPGRMGTAEVLSGAK